MNDYAFTESQAMFDNYKFTLKTMANKMKKPTALRDFILGSGLPYTNHSEAVDRVLRLIGDEYGNMYADEVAELLSGKRDAEVHVSNIDLPARMLSRILKLNTSRSGFDGKYTHDYYAHEAQTSKLPQSVEGFVAKHVVSLERTSFGPPLLYPLRHISEIPEHVPSTLELISDKDGCVITIHGVYFVLVGGELDPDYRRVAINLHKNAKLKVDLANISRAVYTTSGGTRESGVSIERGPLEDNVIICHLGNVQTLLGDRLRNLSRQYVSMVAQAAHTPRSITTTFGEGGRSAINLGEGLLGSLTIRNGGQVVTRRTIRNALSASDLGVLGAHSYLMNHKKALVYPFLGTMAEDEALNRPNEKSKNMALSVFTDMVEQYIANEESQDGQVTYSNHEAINGYLVQTAMAVSSRMINDNPVDAERYARGFIENVFK